MRWLGLLAAGALTGCPAPSGAPAVLATAALEDRVVVTWTLDAREAPRGFRVLRDGELLASLPADARAFDDVTATPGTVGPPRELTASVGTTPDGVRLSWAPAVSSPGPAHRYEVIADLVERTQPSGTATGARAAPTVERYEAARDDEQAWLDAGGGTSWLDTAAPRGTARVTALVTVAPDPPRRGILLRVRNPRVSVDGAPSARYRLRAVAGALQSPVAEATGNRLALPDVAQLHIGWERSASDSVFDFAALPLSGQVVVDDTVPAGLFRSYRPVFTLPGTAPAQGASSRVALLPVSALDSGPDTSCSVDLGGVVACWGGDEGGKTSQTPRSAEFHAVAVGGLHACALRADDHLICWGSDDDGQLAVDPPDGTFSAVAAGERHTCALLTDGRARCWGSDDWGQAHPPPDVFVGLAAWGSASCGVTVDGHVRCWGQAPSAPSGDGFASVTVHRHACALALDGVPTCWGPNEHGQATPPPLERFVSLAAGGTFTCGVREDAALRCWGLAPGGAPSGDFAQVSAGEHHACAVRTDGTLACWGDNAAGQAPVMPPLAALAGLSAAGAVTCALKEDGRALCLGSLSEAPPTDVLAQVRAGPTYACGLRRDGTATCWGAPPELGQSSEADLVELAPGGTHACALKRDGAVVCWGSNGSGEATPPASDGGYVGVTSGPGFSCALRTDGVPECWGAGPVTPPAGLTFTAITAGGHLACGLQPDGHGACWGAQSFDTDAFAREVFSRLAVGADFVCGQTAAGVKCFASWFSTAVAPPPVPQRYLGLAAGSGHVCALKDDGRLECWGSWAGGAAPRF